MKLQNQNQNPTTKKTVSSKSLCDTICDICFSLLLLPAAIGTYFLAKDVQKFRNNLLKLVPSFHLPTYSDFKLCIPILLVILVLKILCENLLVCYTKTILAKQYRNPDTEEKKIESQKVAKKLAQHIFKGTYYILITLFAYYVHKDLDYFPKTLGGSGQLKNMFLPGYPKSFLFTKPKYFDLHYLICLSYAISDLLYLLFIYEKQTDFINMLLHHICTISLIIFSFLTNYSNIGSMVLIIHNATDVLVHMTRFSIRSNTPEIIRDITGVTLTFAFIYLRLFVFGECIYVTIKYIVWEWGWTTTFLITFLCFLYVMHINWTLRLLEKALQLVMGYNLSDTTTFKSSKELNEKKKE